MTTSSFDTGCRCRKVPRSLWCSNVPQRERGTISSKPHAQKEQDDHEPVRCDSVYHRSSDRRDVHRYHPQGQRARSCFAVTRWHAPLRRTSRHQGDRGGDGRNPRTDQVVQGIGCGRGGRVLPYQAGPFDPRLGGVHHPPGD